MSTHRRAWKQRAGVVVALVVGALLAAPATPALAADVTVSPGSVTLNAGSDAAVTVLVRPGNGDDKARISLAGLPGGVSCSGGCGDIDFNNGQPKPHLLRIRANDNAGDANVTVTVAVEANSGPGTAPLQLTVKGRAQPTQAQPQTVKSVSGKVVAQANGKAVPNAVVMLQDGAGKKIDTVSDDDGNFRFNGTTDRPIAPGRLAVGASVGEVYATKSFDAAAGQSITGQRITLAIKVETTPSPTPSTSEEAVPTEEPLEETPTESADAAPGAAANTSNEDSGGMGSWLIILLGGLLVAAGVGTIVLLWMRRKENGDETDDAPAGAAAGAIPAARGGFRGSDDQTRVVNRVGAGPDPTMVGGAALSDAPTMMQRPVVDDVPPDPYGAPPQPYGAAGGQQGWGGNSGYGDEPSGSGGYGGYGNAPSSGSGGYGNAPSSGSGYGNSGGGYGNAPASGGGYGADDYGSAGAGGGRGYGERYDEPTGRYTGDATQYPAPADPYATGVYQPDQGQGYGQSDSGAYRRGGEPTGGYERGGYDQQGGGYGGQQGGGYGQEPAQRGGYDDRGGYGGQQGGGYGQSGGYDQPTSYDNQGGYGGQQGGYGQEPSQRGYDDRGGYGQGGYGQQGGYDEQAGRGRADGPPQQDRGGRRLDWLDD
ncbi:hypothetical protein [Micromonospora sp. NPDC047074]|uniref:hypothetical protein n=1 Tax=Micromonospora sp. NPDC047074 TaxID=3154339 RepID=UPI0033E295D2